MESQNSRESRRLLGQMEAERPFHYRQPTAHLAIAWATRGADTRRWAFYNIGAYMCPIETGKDHGPTQWLEPAPMMSPVPQHIQDRMFTPVQTMRGQTTLGEI